MKSKSFDLTTKEGIKNSVDYIKKNPDILTNGPLVHFTAKAITSFFDTKEKAKTQAEAAFEIIKRGKKEGLKSMKIKVSEEAGIDIQSTMKEFPVKFKIGTNGTMDLEVEY
jgi:hypothetical protein